MKILLIIVTIVLSGCDFSEISRLMGITTEKKEVQCTPNKELLPKGAHYNDPNGSYFVSENPIYKFSNVANYNPDGGICSYSCDPGLIGVPSDSLNTIKCVASAAFVTRWKKPEGSIGIFSFYTGPAPYSFTLDLGDDHSIIAAKSEGDGVTYDYEYPITTSSIIISITANGDDKNTLGVPSFRTSYREGINTMGVESGTNITIVDVLNWGSIKMTNMDSMFYDYAGVDFSAIDTPDTSNVTSMSGMFLYAKPFTIETDFYAFLRQLDTSKVTDMSYMFYEASSCPTDLSWWDTNAVVDMSYMFASCQGLGSNTVSRLNTSNVKNMEGMFSVSRFKKDTLLLWDVKSVENMKAMFEYSDFNADLKWNTIAVTNMERMFVSNYAFNSIIDFKFNNVVNLARMFQNATAFNHSPIDWNLTAAADITDLFNGASAFDQDLSLWQHPPIEASGVSLYSWSKTNVLQGTRMQVYHHETFFPTTLYSELIIPTLEYIEYGVQLIYTYDVPDGTFIRRHLDFSGWDKKSSTIVSSGDWATTTTSIILYPYTEYDSTPDQIFLLSTIPSYYFNTHESAQNVNGTLTFKDVPLPVNLKVTTCNKTSKRGYEYTKTLDTYGAINQYLYGSTGPGGIYTWLEKYRKPVKCEQ